MKRYWLLAMLVASISVVAETVVKQSMPFSFPASVGVLNKSLPVDQRQFVRFDRVAASGAVILSWRVRGNAGSGMLRIFTASGCLVKAFLIQSSAGSVRWEGGAASASRSIHFAEISWGNAVESMRTILN